MPWRLPNLLNNAVHHNGLRHAFLSILLVSIYAIYHRYIYGIIIRYNGTEVIFKMQKQMATLYSENTVDD